MAKKQAAPAATDGELDRFARQVELALEHYPEPDWLAAHSVLATPYVIGHFLPVVHTGNLDAQRARALQMVLEQAVAELDVELGKFITDLYLARNTSLTNTALAMKHHMSQRTFYRFRNRALGAAAEAVYKILLPPLRSEQPAQQPFAGRQPHLAQCLSSLHAGRTVYIAGESGIGKTTLATEVTARWPHPCFWFTVRAGLSDRLASFLFALAHFLRQQGDSLTWRQIVADKGVFELDQVAGLLRYDLRAHRTTPLLICIDELDVLDAARSDHLRLLHLLDDLRPSARLLLVGQRVVMETDVQVALTGFDAAEYAEWLQLAPLPAASGAHAGQQQTILQLTKGNPALLNLLWALPGSSTEFTTTLDTPPALFTADGLAARIWRRLGKAERQLLLELAVFRTAAPADCWRHVQRVVDGLAERMLVQHDGAGGLMCASHIVSFVHRQISAGKAAALQLAAAAALEDRGDFVEAMHHYVQGQQPALAVWLWFTRRTQQINQGKGIPALEILENIPSSSLENERDKAALGLARAELYRLVGKPEKIAGELAGVTLMDSTTVKSYVHQLLADALERQGDIEHAIMTYRRSLETLVGSLPLRQVLLHERIGYLHLVRATDLALAEREAWQSLFHAHTFMANVQELRGNLPGARKYYQEALAIAERFDSRQGMLATAYSHLGKLLLKLGELNDANTMIRQALQLSEERGDSIGPLYDRINLSYLLTVQGEHRAALEIALAGLEQAEAMQHRYLLAGLLAAAGDAACRLGDLAGAEHHATRSLLQEEEFFRAWALTVLGMVQTAQEHYPLALRTLRSAVEMAAEQEDAYGEAYALHALGMALWASEQVEPASAALWRALAAYQSGGMAAEAQRLAEDIARLGVPPT